MPSCKRGDPYDVDDEASVNVYINVYDMMSANQFVYWAGLGIHHSALQIQDKGKFQI